jgi:hypothetical protein
MFISCLKPIRIIYELSLKDILEASDNQVITIIFLIIFSFFNPHLFINEYINLSEVEKYKIYLFYEIENLQYSKNHSFVLFEILIVR